MTRPATAVEVDDPVRDRRRLSELARRAVGLGPAHPAVFFGLIQLCLRFDCMPPEAWRLVERMAEGDFSFDPLFNDQGDAT